MSCFLLGLSALNESLDFGPIYPDPGAAYHGLQQREPRLLVPALNMPATLLLGLPLEISLLHRLMGEKELVKYADC